MSVASRLEDLRDELAHLMRNPGRGTQERLGRVRRRIAMLTEDQRDHNPDRKAKGQGE